MLFKDINQQANEILENTSNKEEVLIEKKKGKFDTFKSAVGNAIKKGSNTAKDLVDDGFDDGFDDLIRDGKNSSDERDKIEKAKKDGKSGLDIWKDSALNAIAGEDGKSNNKRDKENKEDENSVGDTISDGDEKDTAPKKADEKITLTSKDQVRLEKNIFAQDNKTKRTIFKSLVTLYNGLVDKKKLKTEAFDYLSIDRRLLSDQELSRILDYIYNAQRRNKTDVKESIILEDTVKKIKNNVVSKEWKKRGSKRDKDSLVKLMRFFKLSDMQIFTAFEKVDKDLTYDELRRLKIDIKHTNMPVTKQDLEKLVHTLGKFKLKQFLIKLKNSIKK